MKIAKFYLMFVSVAIAIFTVPKQIPAQAFSSGLSTTVSDMIWAGIEKNVMTNGMKRKSGGTPAGGCGFDNSASGVIQLSPAKTNDAPRISAAQANLAVRFKSTGTRVMLQAMADQIGGSDEQKQQTAKLLSTILDGYDREAGKKGYPNDLALALASFIAFNSAVYQEKAIAPDEKILEVRNVIAELAAQNGFYKGTTDRRRQEIYEVLVMSGGLTYVSYQDAKQRNSVDEMKLFKQMAATNIETLLKMEPDTLNFTAESVNAASAQDTQAGPALASTDPINIGQLRWDFGENVARADQLYTGKRLVFVGIVNEVAPSYRKSGCERDLGANLLVVGHPDRMLDHEAHVFFRDKNQLAQLRHNKEITFEATVQGMWTDNNYDVILTDAVLH